MGIGLCQQTQRGLSSHFFFFSTDCREKNSFYGHDMIVLSHLIWPSFPATAVHLGFFAAACIKIAHAQHMGK